MTRYRGGKGRHGNNQRRRKRSGPQHGPGRHSGMAARIRHERALREEGGS